MIAKVEIPEISKYPDGFPSHWLNLIFSGNRPDEYKIHAIVTTYVRLIEGAFVHYRQARLHVLEFWNELHSLPIGRLNLSSTYFENCIDLMHRAVLCMRGIRCNPEVPTVLRAAFPTEPNFATEAIADRLRKLRNSVQHMDEKVAGGQIEKGAPFMLLATGEESPMPDQPDQTLKVIDRLIIGDRHILFSELATWLIEMGDCAELISNVQFVSMPPPHTADP